MIAVQQFAPAVSWALVSLVALALGLFVYIGVALYIGGPAPRGLGWILNNPDGHGKQTPCRFGCEDCIDAALYDDDEWSA